LARVKVSAAPATYTLSLHDALPICLQGLVEQVQGGRLLSEQRQGLDGGDRLDLDALDLRIALQERDGGQVRRAGDGEQAQLVGRSEEHTSELQSRENLVCRLLLEKK